LLTTLEKQGVSDMENTVYDGWSSYATWRVNSEFFDDGKIKKYEPIDKYDPATNLMEIVEDYIMENSTGYAESYAREFLHDVDWQEIVDHHIS
jgi:hypothetical protein